MNDSSKDAIAKSMLVVNALTSAGFAFVGLVAEPGNIAALYSLARIVPIAAVVIAAVAMRARLVTLGVLLAIIQGCDALVGLAQHDAMKAIGPLVFAIATAFAVRRLRRTSPG